MRESNVENTKLMSSELSSGTSSVLPQDGPSAFIQEMEKVFGAIPPEPTQEAIDGIRFDFNCGLRVKIPKGKAYRVTSTETARTTFC